MNLHPSLRQIGLVIFLLFAGGVGGVALDRGLLVDYWPIDGIPPAANATFRLVTEAWKIIDGQYVDRANVSIEELGYGAISGMVDALGDTGHSRFLSPDMVKAQHEYNQGEFEGVGAYVEMKDGHVVIVAPIDNSPAQAAGIMPGDIILSVDGEDVTQGLTLNEIVQRVLGPAGSRVTLVVLSPSSGVQRELTLVREKVALQNVKWQQLPGTTMAHVRISAFSQGVTDDLKQALAEIEAQGITGLILDLRTNPGGLLSEAVGTASQFLTDGQKVLVQQNAQGEMKATPVISNGAAPDLPMIVLTNEGSASASEIVAGALQDNGRALVVGATTFGTGTVLNEFDLSDGSALLLATEQWLTPSGRRIWHQGIEPDVPVAMESGDGMLLPEAERGLTADELGQSGDAQLLKAMELLLTSPNKPAKLDSG